MLQALATQDPPTSPQARRLKYRLGKQMGTVQMGRSGSIHSKFTGMTQENPTADSTHVPYTHPTADSIHMAYTHHRRKHGKEYKCFRNPERSKEISMSTRNFYFSEYWTGVTLLLISFSPFVLGVVSDAERESARDEGGERR